ncbi:3'-5' exonuclease [Streptomyces canus]|uniref:3'-5' exonuclease n=1 Tax=Streptomyces canus TaxID=58343 RepID=UPI00277FA6F5|nr:3'-5' exonuclease [Streptomyces canus]MDQ0758761.1 DNA polymerase III epsilon subunit-like protein [Streptomyces canus]
MNTSSPAKAPRPLAFIDTETTGLDVDHHDAWEIAVIHRRPGHPDTEYLWQIRVSLAEADPEALDINGYHKRFAVPEGELAVRIATDATPADRPVSGRDLMLDLMGILDGSVLVGSNPAFDERFLTKLFRQAGATPAWHYRTRDIATMAVGHLYGQAYTLTKQSCDAEFYARADRLLEDGWKSYDLSRLMGIEPPAKDDAHTALGDARWARDVYDAITKADAFYTASDEQLAELAGQALSKVGQQ